MSGEKTEQPTAQKLKKAKQEGQIGRSQDVGAWFGMLAASMPNQAPTSWLRPIWPSCLAFLSFCAVGCSVFSPLTPTRSADAQRR